MNNGYVFPGYFALLKEYAFKPKEPVVHPALRRAPEPGRAFRPRVRAQQRLRPRHRAGAGRAAEGMILPDRRRLAFLHAVSQMAR